MEQSRRGEDQVPMSHAFPPLGRRQHLPSAWSVPEASGEALSVRQTMEPPPLPVSLAL